MHHLTIQHLATMQHLPQLDRKMLIYAVSWVLAIATLMIGIAVFG